MLKTKERRIFRKCEKQISKYGFTVIDSWRAIERIQDEGLYRDDEKTFDDYCKKKYKKGTRAIKTILRKAELIQRFEKHPYLRRRLPKNDREIRMLLALDQQIQLNAWTKILRSNRNITIGTKLIERSVYYADHEFLNHKVKIQCPKQEIIYHDSNLEIFKLETAIDYMCRIIVEIDKWALKNKSLHSEFFYWADQAIKEYEKTLSTPILTLAQLLPQGQPQYDEQRLSCQPCEPASDYMYRILKTFFFVAHNQIDFDGRFLLRLRQSICGYKHLKAHLTDQKMWEQQYEMRKYLK